MSTTFASNTVTVIALEGIFVGVCFMILLIEAVSLSIYKKKTHLALLIASAFSLAKYLDKFIFNISQIKLDTGGANVNGVLLDFASFLAETPAIYISYAKAMAITHQFKYRRLIHISVLIMVVLSLLLRFSRYSCDIGQCTLDAGYKSLLLMLARL
ncbi:hypothetical protein HK096_001391, partial [Nowakowskiella sp. JEL0078]